MLIVAVVGLARSGKDTVAELLSQSHGFQHFDFFRDVIVPLMEKQGISASKENAVKFGNQMRAKFGMGVFGEKMAEKARGNEKVAVTGARSLEELKHLEEIAERFYIVKVSSPREQRFSRRSELDPGEEEEFFGRDADDIEKKGLEAVLKAADFSIENSGSMEELGKKLEAVMARIEQRL